MGLYWPGDSWMHVNAAATYILSNSQIADRNFSWISQTLEDEAGHVSQGYDAPQRASV